MTKQIINEQAVVPDLSQQAAQSAVLQTEKREQNIQDEQIVEIEVAGTQQTGSIYPLKITNKQIKALQNFHFEGSIHQITHIKEVPNVVSFLKSRKVLGFDTESVLTKSIGQSINRVSILQFASEKNSFVIQLLCIGQSMRISGNKGHLIKGALRQFIDVLQSRTVWKVGSGIHADVVKIQELMDFQPRGFVDTQNLCSRLGMISTGLRASSAILFGVCMKEFPYWANWESGNLGSKEVRYAAEDAVMSRRLYKELRRRLKVRGVTKVKQIGKDITKNKSIFQHIEGILLGAAARNKKCQTGIPINI